MLLDLSPYASACARQGEGFEVNGDRLAGTGQGLLPGQVQGSHLDGNVPEGVFP